MRSRTMWQTFLGTPAPSIGKYPVRLNSWRAWVWISEIFLSAEYYLQRWWSVCIHKYGSSCRVVWRSILIYEFRCVNEIAVRCDVKYLSFTHRKRVISSSYTMSADVDLVWSKRGGKLVQGQCQCFLTCMLSLWSWIRGVVVLMKQHTDLLISNGFSRAVWRTCVIGIPNVFFSFVPSTWARKWNRWKRKSCTFTNLRTITSEIELVLSRGKSNDTDYLRIVYASWFDSKIRRKIPSGK